MSGARDPGENKVKVDDDFVGRTRPFRIRPATRNGSVDHNVHNFTPRGILINHRVSETDEKAYDVTATTAVVRMALWGEPEAARDDYRLAVGVVHPLRPAAIFMSKSTARGIIVVG